jgi:hypothetical protein
VLRKVGAAVAAHDREGQPGRRGDVAVGEAGVAVLLDLQRLGPRVLDRVAEAVQRAHAGVAAPGEDELARAARPDQLVVDDVGRHPDERQPAAALARDLVARGHRDQVREALERDGVAVVDELGDGLAEGDDGGVCSHRVVVCSPRTQDVKRFRV